MIKNKFKFILLFTFIIFGSAFYISSTSQAASNKMRLNVNKLNMTKDTKYTLRAYNVKKKYSTTFTSSDTSIVDFSYQKPKQKRARLFAVNVGTATVTVTIRSKKKIVSRLRCEITVGPQAISIKFPKNDISLLPGESQLFRPILKPNTSFEIPTYFSDNMVVATVNSKGKINALSPGIAVVTATLSTGQTAKYTIHVGNYPEDMPYPYPSPYQQQELGQIIE